MKLQGLPELFCLLLSIFTCFGFVSAKPSILTRLEHGVKEEFHSAAHQLSNYLSSYDPSVGLRNLYFAYGAYCPESSLETWSCKWCDYISNFNVSKVFKKDELQVFIGLDNDGDQIVVSFRGSSNLEDWLDDLDYFKTGYPWVSGGEVHRGFYEAWGYLSDEVMNVTAQLMDLNPSTTVLVTGHSLGAALAQIAAANFSRYVQDSDVNDNEVITYTYGSPRWANKAVADYYADMIDLNWRFVNLRDIVPTVPPEDFGFHHTWTEVHYTSDSPLEYKVCDGSGEDESCSYDIPSADDHLWYFDLYEDCRDDSQIEIELKNNKKKSQVAST